MHILAVRSQTRSAPLFFCGCSCMYSMGNGIKIKTKSRQLRPPPLKPPPSFKGSAVVRRPSHHEDCLYSPFRGKRCCQNCFHSALVARCHVCLLYVRLIGGGKLLAVLKVRSAYMPLVPLFAGLQQARHQVNDDSRAPSRRSSSVRHRRHGR